MLIKYSAHGDTIMKYGRMNYYFKILVTRMRFKKVEKILI
jgi:hypothetical protein